MRKEILEFLEDSHDYKEINNLLESIAGKTSLFALRALLIEMGITGDKVIICPTAETLMMRDTTKYYDLSNTIIEAKITNKGREELVAYRNKEHSLQVNQSIIRTNESVIRTNENVTVANNSAQRLGGKTLLVAMVSALAIIASVYVSTKGVTSEDIRSLNRQLQRNTQLLDSIRQYQKGIDSSLRKAVKDSFCRR